MGTWRRSAVEVGQAILTLSPDGMSLAFGNANSRMYTVPNAATALIGGEFSSYEAGPNLTTIIRRYHTGAQAAYEHALLPLGALCIYGNPVEVRDLPQQSGMLDFAFAQGGTRVTVSAGEASFSCGAGLVQYVFATTQEAAIGGTAIWTVSPVAVFVAPEARAGEAMELLIHIVGSLQMNPDWAARQGTTTRAVNAIVANTNTAIFTSISDSFWYRRALEDQTFARGSEARRGVRTYFDPALGERHELDNQGYKWINPSGQIVTTTTEDAPAPGFREMRPVTP
jgi:hypothetical protein